MDSAAERRTQAEQVFERRSLREFSDTVTDPALRAQAQQLAAGRMSAAEFVRHMERSATAMRGVDRFVKQVVALSPQELEAIRAARERDIEHTATELAMQRTTPIVGPRGSRRIRRIEEDENTWDEPQSWLE
jgi:hypothetical protein